MEKKSFSYWEEYFGLWFKFDDKTLLMTKEEFAIEVKFRGVIRADSNGGKMMELSSFWNEEDEEYLTLEEL
ncbi:hypothetical protein P4639_22310 [Priestia megaterium]|uniref:hypothetical protein n=1 Tax=Priestia megaterium TaxID=1404 RepID=UPI002E1B1120|nr:hypothetical protein [Priestia megaterium]